MTRLLTWALGIAVAIATASAASAGTLQTVQARGYLQCGVNTGLPGFGYTNSSGEWAGFDVDYCRAVAAAVFGDPTKVKFTPLDATQRFTALQNREVDVLIRNTTWTMSRDTTLGLSFAGVNYYDGQGFMVHKELGVKSLKELSGATVCVQNGTDTQINMADYFRSHNLSYKPLSFEKLPDAIAAYDGGRCDAWTTDASGLAATRLQLKNPDDDIILPEIISKEPLGPVVRQGDDQWFNVVKWTHYALLDAEELGITKANVDEMKKTSTSPETRRLLGVEGNFGKGVGLSNDWAYNVIKTLGNYGEIFDRNLGAASPLKIKRGLNALWTDGGLQYGMPVL